jgi:hypothetical protein
VFAIISAGDTRISKLYLFCIGVPIYLAIVSFGAWLLVAHQQTRCVALAEVSRPNAILVEDDIEVAQIYRPE